jgi:hypothetical protein
MTRNQRQVLDCITRGSWLRLRKDGWTLTQPGYVIGAAGGNATIDMLRSDAYIDTGNCITEKRAINTRV